MTSFEKSINRGMNRKKFEEIRDHVYGDGKNIFKYRYGDVSSWFTWNRDKNGKIASPDSPDPAFTRGRTMFDGFMDKWDNRFASKITTDIVFLGLNMSGDGKKMKDSKGNDFPCFQNARDHEFVVKTFFDTKAEGGYFTDIIKPDKRLLNNVDKPANRKEVMQIIKEHPDILVDHIRLFKKELDFIGADKPLLIVFGNDAFSILKKGLDNNFLEKRFHAVVKIYHYSFIYIKGGLKEYKNDTKKKLKPYITIP